MTYHSDEERRQMLRELPGRILQDHNAQPALFLLGAAIAIYGSTAVLYLLGAIL